MIKTTGFTYEKFKFPCGELQIKIDKNNVGLVNEIVWEFENTDEIFEMQLLIDTMQRHNIGIDNLIIPYFPFSRQDRANETGECLSLKLMARMVNGWGANRVKILDPHSDVTTAMLNNVVVVEQHVIFKNMIKAGPKEFFLISPDGGSLKKINKLAMLTNPQGVIECSKKRDVLTGEITDTLVHVDDLEGKDCYIVDDICDGGRTFIEIAKVLKKKNAGKIILMVTHGFFTKGMKVFDGLIDEFYTRKGNLKGSTEEFLIKLASNEEN